MNGLTGIRIGLGTFIGAVSWFLGGLDGLLMALLVMICVDYVSGVIKAVVEKKLSSEIGVTGIAKKVVILLLVGVAHIIDIYVLGAAGVTRAAVILFFISNEGISILENAALIGLPIPRKLKEILLQIGKKSEEDGE